MQVIVLQCQIPRRPCPCRPTGGSPPTLRCTSAPPACSAECSANTDLQRGRSSRGLRAGPPLKTGSAGWNQRCLRPRDRHAGCTAFAHSRAESVHRWLFCDRLPVRLDETRKKTCHLARPCLTIQTKGPNYITATSESRVCAPQERCEQASNNGGSHR